MEERNTPISQAQALIEAEMDKYRLKEHFKEYNQVTIFRSNKSQPDASRYKAVVYMYDATTDGTVVDLMAMKPFTKEPVDYGKITDGYDSGLKDVKYSEYIVISVDMAGGEVAKVSSQWRNSSDYYFYNASINSSWVCPYSSLKPLQFPNLKNNLSLDPVAEIIQQGVSSRIGLQLRNEVNEHVCTGHKYFIYNKSLKDPNARECLVFNRLVSGSDVLGYKFTTNASVLPIRWTINEIGAVKPTDYNGNPMVTIYTNASKYIEELNRYSGGIFTNYISAIYVKTPNEIGDAGITDKDCVGNPFGDADSELTGPIKDLLDQNKKTFYLLGRKSADSEPKLYLFDLGQVGGVLTYTHIKDAIVYKQVKCKWVKDVPNVQDLKFSSLEEEVDTNFYLLTHDKLDQPSKITVITQRKANEYLVKHFPTCTVTRPEGGENPNDNLKPDFGGGGGGDIGGIGGGGGFFPENNNPLPNPEVPPCNGNEGGSQTPVSKIWLLSVPELSPTYDDTYDFPTIEAQEKFFISKNGFTLDRYSYLRKDNAIQVGSHVDNLKCYNYLMYKNKMGKWYYCFIMDKQYINERTARIIIATDVIQTYLFDYTVPPCFVERCHVDRWRNGVPTNEYEPEGLEFGDPIQIEKISSGFKKFGSAYIAVASDPLGLIPSRSEAVTPKPPAGGGGSGGGNPIVPDDLEKPSKEVN